MKNETSIKALIMIMAKVPELGKCKTRLAATVGDEAALKVYIELLQHTYSITDKVDADKVVFFTDGGEGFDMLDYYKYMKESQVSGELGERMSSCFQWAFNRGYERVIIMGSDCFELDEEILQEAVHSLSENEFVIGPAKDGGYYLLGMSAMHPALFEGKSWSTENVFLDTLIDIKATEKTYHVLQTLSDVDTEADLGPELRKLMSK